MESSSTPATPTDERLAFIAAVAQPGDTVLIGFADALDDEAIRMLDDYFRPITELGIQVHFMDQVSAMVVVRPGATLAPEDWADEARAAAEGEGFDKEFPS